MSYIKTDSWITSPGAKAVPGTVIGQLLDPDSPEGKIAQHIYDEGLCRNCGRRRAARTFAHDSMTLAHGGGQPYCETCIAKEKFIHAYRGAIILPKAIYKLCRARIANK